MATIDILGKIRIELADYFKRTQKHATIIQIPYSLYPFALLDLGPTNSIKDKNGFWIYCDARLVSYEGHTISVTEERLIKSKTRS